MFLNYIILAHKNPLQVHRLIKRLSEPWTKFYIHIDRNTNINPFKELILENENITFLKNREIGTWGDIGIVKATINAVQQIVVRKLKGTTILLTGQDYPIKSNEEIYSFFRNNPNTNFIQAFPLPYKGWENNGLDRIEKYKIIKSNKRGHYLMLPSIFDKDFFQYETLGKLNYLRKNGDFKTIKKIFIKRKFPENIKPYGGSVYWALPLKTLKLITDFIEDHPDYMEYHKYTLCADEIFFHSIIKNLIPIANNIESRTLTYMNWKRKNMPLPVTFGTHDFEEIKVSSNHYFFARKFDETVDSQILNRIDTNLLH